MIHGDVLGERARLSPDRTALVLAGSGRRFTYSELDGRARRLAHALLGPLGLVPGDRLGLLSHNRLEFLDVFFAAGKAGVVLVPLGTRLHPRELLPIVSDAGLSALLFDGALGATARAIAGGIPKRVALDVAGEGEPALSDLVAAVAEDVGPLPSRAPEDLYALLYTSGTTGRPKGVRVPHRMVGWNAVNTALGWQLREDDVSPVFTPLYHAGGLGAFLTPILAAGGTIVLHEGFDAVEVWRAIERERATVVLGVPTIWKMLLECPEIDRVDTSSIRWLISGGAPLPLPLLAAYRARGLVLRQGYGMTEVGVNCFAMSNEEASTKAGSIGRPLPFTRARVVDDEGRVLPRGEVGELCLAGPHVCQGYWNDPEATRAAIDPDGFFHTGDLAREDEDGFFTIAGRKKEMLISGGVNVYPAEIEAVLLGHPGIAEAAVAGVPDATWGEVAAAFVVPRPGASLDAPGLAAYVGERLSRIKVPKAWVFVEGLPVTAYGKVVKGELRKLWEARRPGTLAHKVDGAGGETLLLLNGGMMSIGSWEPFAAPLAATLRIVRCDLRGQLLSPGPPPSTLDGHVADLVALLDTLGLARVHVLGTSYGGEVGVLLAARHPERVASLTVVASVDRFDEAMDAEVRKLREAARAVLAGGERRVLYERVASTAYSAAYHEEHRQEIEARGRTVALLPEAWYRDLDGFLVPLLGLDLRPWLGAIRCPTAIVVAGEDAVMPRPYAEGLAAGIAGATLHVLQGAGHAVILEDAGSVRSILLDCVSRADPRSPAAR